MKSNLIYLLFIATCTLLSCNDDKDNSAINDAYISGEIINPNSNFIVFRKSGTLIDTVKLNKQNRFFYTLKDFKPGLYDFYDGKEYQNILIEANDSLKMRLNTLDFDESLVYTGIGGKENNFLMDMYLLNEQENDKILGLGQKNAEEFDNVYRASRDRKLNKLKAFKLKNETSTLFDEIAEASINYEYYAHKELYPLANYKISELDAFRNLPSNFYDYRNYIDYNNATLKDFSPYLTFLRFHFNNIALQEHFSHSKDSAYNKLDLHYNLDKLELIDKSVKNEDIKNGLLRSVMRQFINVSQKTDDYDQMLESFTVKSTNKRDKEYAKSIVSSYKRLKTGNKFPDVTLLDENSKKVNLTKNIKKPIIVYFWTKKNKNHSISSHKRAKELNVKYPEFDFISINTDEISAKEQENILKSYNVRNHNEYRFENPKKAKEILSINPILKVFIINKNGEIENAKANMFNIAFEQELLGIINR